MIYKGIFSIFFIEGQEMDFNPKIFTGIAIEKALICQSFYRNHNLESLEFSVAIQTSPGPRKIQISTMYSILEAMAIHFYIH